MHGGRTPRGVASANTRHGLYSADLSVRFLGAWSIADNSVTLVGGRVEEGPDGCLCRVAEREAGVSDRVAQHDREFSGRKPMRSHGVGADGAPEIAGSFRPSGP